MKKSPDSRPIGTGSRPLKSEFKTEVLRGSAAYGIETECFSDQVNTGVKDFTSFKVDLKISVRELYHQSSKWTDKFAGTFEILPRLKIFTAILCREQLPQDKVGNENTRLIAQKRREKANTGQNNK